MERVGENSKRGSSLSANLMPRPDMPRPYDISSPTGRSLPLTAPPVMTAGGSLVQGIRNFKSINGLDSRHCLLLCFLGDCTPSTQTLLPSCRLPRAIPFALPRSKGLLCRRTGLRQPRATVRATSCVNLSSLTST